jgi:hypothetical protein
MQAPLNKKAFWDTVKKLQGNVPHSEIIILNDPDTNNIVSDSTKISDIFADFFEKKTSGPSKMH